MNSMTPSITSWHAHVYFSAETRDAAWALRERIEAEIPTLMAMGRFHEKAVGPHPMWTYQLAIEAQDFAAMTSWLVLSHGQLDVFLHPNTGDTLADHRDRAMWIGRSYPLNLAALGG